MIREIPRQLADEPLIRVCRPDCESHVDCGNPGKRIVVSANHGEPIDAIREWLAGGGSGGHSLSGDLVALDLDTDMFANLATEYQSPTFEFLTDGGGRCRIYRCPLWGPCRKWQDGDLELGSIRSNVWQVVIPPSLHKSGNRYRVLQDRPIVTVEPSHIYDLAAAMDAATNTPRGGGRDRERSDTAAPGRVGGNPLLPDDYPSRSADWTTIRKWLKANPPIWRKYEQSTSTDWSGDEYAVAKCLAEGGFDEASIRSALDTIIRPTGAHSTDGDATVVFLLDGYEVTVKRAGTVVVRPTTAPTEVE